jgi:hypothetical protein
VLFRTNGKALATRDRTLAFSEGGSLVRSLLLFVVQASAARPQNASSSSIAGIPGNRVQTLDSTHCDQSLPTAHVTAPGSERSVLALDRGQAVSISPEHELEPALLELAVVGGGRSRRAHVAMRSPS